MADFPTLSIGPVDPFSEKYSDAGDLVSPVEAGYKITRRQFTRRTKIITARYYPMTSADKATMLTFIAAQGTVGNFNWTDPITSAVHDVRFVEIPEITTVGVLSDMPCKMEEV